MTSFSTAAMVWVNSQVAMLARVYHLEAFRPVWHAAGPQTWSLTVHSESFSVSTLFETDLLANAFEGEESHCAILLRTLRTLVRSAAVTNP